MSDVYALAAECGFRHTAPLRPEQLVFRQEVRDMCAAGRCGNYGRSWSCPPACPSLEEMRRRAAAFDGGILVQTVVELEDDFDFEGMMDGERRHKAQFGRLVERLREQFPGRDALLPMGTGGCSRCGACTYPDSPCRFPEEQMISMEAYGLLVSQVCESCGVPYYYGPGTLAYASCILLRTGAGRGTGNQNN